MVSITMSNVYWRENKSHHCSSELVGAFSFWLDLAALPHLLARNPAFPNDCIGHAGRVGAVVAVVEFRRALGNWGVDTGMRIRP